MKGFIASALAASLRASKMELNTPFTLRFPMTRRSAVSECAA
ncbi:hypothetical protein [Mesorhizobium sp. LNJC399B00]